MDVSAASNAKFVSFRQLVYNCSQQFSREEIHAIVYIHLYNQREKFKDASGLAVLSKLETDGVFSPWNPEGLLEVVKELKRHDLIAEIKDFLKKKWPRVVKKATKKQSLEIEPLEEDLYLKATFEVAIAQATVLMQQIETFQRILHSEKNPREKVKDVVVGATQTAQALADRLLQAQENLYPTSHQVTSPECAVGDEYVDLTSLASPRVLYHPQTTSSSTPTYSIPIDLPTDLKIPISSEPPKEDEYVDMSATQTQLKAIQGWRRDNTQTDLASCYGDSPATKKGGSTVSPSTAVAMVKRVSTDSVLTMYPNKAHMSSSTDSVATGSGNDSLTHSYDTTDTGGHSVSVSSSDVETSFSPHGSVGVVYGNIQDLHRKSLPLKKSPMHESNTSSDNTTTSHPEAIYSNILRPQNIVIPPRDIQRQGASASLPTCNYISKELPKEMNNERCTAEERTPLVVAPPPEVSDCTQTHGQTGEKKESVTGKPEVDPMVVSTRPLIAPKPKPRSRPEIPPRRSSLSHAARMRVGGPKVASRNLRSSSVVGTVKNAVNLSTNQNEIEEGYVLAGDTASCADDSGFTDELELKLLRQMATNTAPLLGESHYYKQLHPTEPQQDDTDRAYATVHHH